MPPTASAAVQAIGRVMLAVIFVLSGFGKISAPTPTIGYITAGGLPFPELAYYIACAVEFGGGLLILVGLQTRFVAFVLAGWCLVTGAIFHDQPGDPEQMINLMKNVAMAGGFLQLLAVGGGAWSLDALFGRRSA